MRLSKKGTITAGLAGVVAILLVAAPSAPAQATSSPPTILVAAHDHAQHNPATASSTGADTVAPLASVFPCDFLTHMCVKNNKSETAWIAAHTGALSGGGLAGAGALCDKLPLPFPTKVACVAVVGTGGGALADSYNSAAAQGKCVELHFSINLLGLTHWKTEGC